MLAILLVWWPEFSRLMRGQVLVTKANDYVIAGRALGAPGLRALLAHVLPNAFPPIVVKAHPRRGERDHPDRGAVLHRPRRGAARRREWGAMIAAGQGEVRVLVGRHVPRTRDPLRRPRASTSSETGSRIG